MSGVDLLLAATAGGGALLLAIGGVQKLRRPGPLAAAVRTQGLLPPALARGVVPLVPYLELAAAVAFVLSQRTAGAQRLALLAVFTALAALYTGYLLLLWSRRSGASCGCLGSTEPVNAFHVLRVACMTTSGALLAVLPPAPSSPARLPAVLVLSACCALLYWFIPLLAASTGRTVGPSG